ncbi:MAG: DnaJ domain-containing protein [Chitinophagales bacterium]|nr:DnaJ domain-containing protein [Chitinophagales bacterium]
MDYYYRILGLQPGAKEEDIKKAYRRLVLKYHPDRNGNNPKAVERFREVQKAYEVLTSQPTYQYKPRGSSARRDSQYEYRHQHTEYKQNINWEAYYQAKADEARAKKAESNRTWYSSLFVVAILMSLRILLQDSCNNNPNEAQYQQYYELFKADTLNTDSIILHYTKDTMR